MSTQDPMIVAIVEAQASLDEGGMPVGSVIVKAGSIIGRGRNRYAQTGDPTTHAEMEAIRDAVASSGGADAVTLLTGTTCYTTMMPCEMCAGALIRFGIRRVVVAESETYIDAGTQPLMERQGITVAIGGSEKAIGLVRRYFDDHPEIAAAMTAPDRRRLKL